MTIDHPLALGAEKTFRRGFGAVLRIAPDGLPAFDIDGRGETCVIRAASDAIPQCLWRANAETLNRIFEGGRALESAYLSGRLQIAGDISVMARLLLESAR
ncbi:MAG TPA: SCP2 sterol-binding domain-containing protein [Parvularculaceae bacterium]|nr:SCP2 sterol-binding domain-containing protein [Parvularculaceae bacterium]HNS86418.1 SCP2 sterol-binding domain-containing protein [Parvularculaceae bacterium]